VSFKAFFGSINSKLQLFNAPVLPSVHSGVPGDRKDPPADAAHEGECVHHDPRRTLRHALIRPERYYHIHVV